VSRVRAPGGALERIVFGDIGAPGTVLFLVLILLDKLLYKAGNTCYIEISQRETNV